MKKAVHSVRILYIDDSPSDVLLVRIALEEAGDQLNAELKHVGTAQDYLHALANEKFDIILSDYRMPGFNGDDALNAAQEKCPHVPFIMVTGELGEERAIETLKRGATDYVLKDRMFRLVPAITRALAESELQQKRREAEEEARQAHREANEVLESVQDPFYAVDSEWHFTYVNSKAEAHLCKTRDELLGRNLWEMFSQAVGTFSDEMLHKAMQERVPVRFDTLSAVTGNWIEVQVFPKADGGLSVLHRDISERKQGEQALRESRETLGLAVETTHLGLFDFDPQSGALRWNDIAREQFGLPRDAGIDYDLFLQGLHPDDRARVDESMKRALQPGSGSDYHIEYRAVGIQDRKERWLEARARILFDEKGRPVRLLGAMTDITSRKHSDDEIRRANERLSILLEGAAEGLIVYDKDFRFLFIGASSAADFRSMGRDPDAMLGRVFWEEFPEFEGSMPLQKMRQAMTERVVVRFESPYRGRWYETRCIPISEGNLGILAIDISERKQMEDRLRESEEVSRLALAAGRAGTWSWDMQKNALHWSDEFYGVFGMEPGSVTPTFEGGFSHVHPDDQHRVALLVEQVIASGRAFDETHRVIWPDGSVRWVRGMGKAFLDPSTDQKPRRLVGLVIDVTAQKDAEENLKDLNQELARRNLELEAERLKWQNLIAGIADEVWACDLEGKVSMLNLVPQTGTGPAELREEDLGRILGEFEVLRSDGSIRPVEDSPLQRALKGEVVRGEEIVRLRTTGETRIRQHSASPVRDVEGTIVGSVAIVRDITETRKAESEFRRLNEELEERVHQRTAALERANKELEAFSYTVSHDLKSPLRAIDSFVRLLVDPAQNLQPEKQVHYLQLIQTSTEQMTKLIESLLAFARTSRQVPRKARVDMLQLAEQVVQEQRQILGEAASHTHVMIGEMPREADGDPVLLKQVFANLISNAFKFTRKREEPRIEIGGYQENGHQVYFVRDNGAGFPSEKADDLFQVFQRLHLQSDFEGTGIGLANVRKIIERHGGHVWAKGEAGQGAMLFFALPLF